MVHGVNGLGPVKHFGKIHDPTINLNDTQKAKRADSVELSPEAKSLDRVKETTQEKVQRIRDEIEKGTYYTPNKMLIALDRFIDDAIDDL